MLYLAAALLIGLTSSERMGEQSPALLVQADAWLGEHVRVEAQWDAAHKIETGDGWSARGAADWRTGPLTLGAGYTYRHTSAWSKDVWWARAGIQSGPLWLLASVAPDSPNREAKVEARLRGQYKHLLIEPRAWIGTHSTVEKLGGYAYGLEVLVGVAR